MITISQSFFNRHAPRTIRISLKVSQDPKEKKKKAAPANRTRDFSQRVGRRRIPYFYYTCSRAHAGIHILLHHRIGVALMPSPRINTVLCVDYTHCSSQSLPPSKSLSSVSLFCLPTSDLVP
jgi:hypothetical protein